MDFWNYRTLREACKHSGVNEEPDDFYRSAFADAVAQGSGQFYGQLQNEREWEQARRPYYSVWPSIVPMLTRLNLDLDSTLIRLPLPVLCVRFSKKNNPLTFSWQEKQTPIRSILLGEINEGQALSMLIDVGEVIADGPLEIPVYTYRNFPRKSGLTVEQSIAGLRHDDLAEMGIQIPESLVMDCVRLCCTLCLLDNDPSVIEPDVLSKDRRKFDDTGDQKYVEKAHRRGKVGWNIGHRIEVSPHFRRPHLMLAWTGVGRSVPKVVPRRGTIVHRNVVEKVPSGFGN